MKRQILTVVLALVLVLSLVAMIACETECKHNYVDGVCTECGAEDPNAKKDDGGSTAEVPTEEGKVTYYFTLADSSPEQGSYASYWIVGAITGWAETPDDGALEAKNVEGTRIYYIITDAPTKNDDGTYDDGFKVTLGYNASSTLPNDQLGVSWNYQSDECPDGLDNQHFTYTEGAKVVNLGTQTFSVKMAAPVRVDTTLVVNFAEALPEGAKVAIIGGFNGWSIDNSWATISEDGKSASLELKGVLCMPHEYKIKVFTEYEEGKFWNDESQDPQVPYGVEFAGYEGKNLSVEILSADNGEELVLNDKFDKVGWALVLPTDGSHSVHIYDDSSLITLKIKFTAPVTRPFVVIKGSFDGWAGFHNMTANAEKTEYTYTISGLAAGTYEFLVCVNNADDDGNMIEDYDQKIAGTGEIGAASNAMLTIVAGTTEYDLFENAIELPDESAVVDVETTLVVKFDEALPEAASVVIYGDMNGWGGDSFENKQIKEDEKAKIYLTANDDRTEWSISMKLKTSSYEYKIEVYPGGWNGNKDTQWSGKQYAGEDGTGTENAKVTPAEGKVELFGGATLAAPDYYNGSITFKVTLAEALPENYIVFFVGTLTGWSDSYDFLMTISEDRKTLTYTVEHPTLGEHEYKGIVHSNNPYSGDFWNPGEGSTCVFVTNNGQNSKVTISADSPAEIVLFADLSFGA